MLIQLNKKQRNITSTIVLMVIGGWLVLFCQNCLAVIGQVDDSVLLPSEANNPCHSVDTNQSTHDLHDDSTELHCLGACDCYDMDASFNNNVNHDQGQNERFKNTIDIFHVFSVSTEKFIESNYTYPTATLPEQAIRIPLQHFTVLLN